MRRRLAQIPGKLKAPWAGHRPRLSLKYAFWSFASSAAGIAAIYGVAGLADQQLLIGSFGASAVLLFGAPDSPLAQPRNVIGGHVVSAAVAVVITALLGPTPLAVALAVGLAILAMNLTRTMHPPGGATALIGVQGAATPLFILTPVLAGAVILLGVALFTNNFVYHRRYPQHWC